MLDTVPLQSRFLDHADHYARWSGLAIGVEASPSLLALPTYRPPLALGDGALVNGGVAAPEGAS